MDRGGTALEGENSQTYELKFLQVYKPPTRGLATVLIVKCPELTNATGFAV